MTRPWQKGAFLTAGVVGAAVAWLWLDGDWGMDEQAPPLDKVAFAELPGWNADDHLAALHAFRRSCEAMSKTASGSGEEPLQTICADALALRGDLSPEQARSFYESHFTPHRYRDDGPSGFVTGYFEPELSGARERDQRFNVPVYRQPDDLVRPASGAGQVSYPDRRAIEQGALAGRGLELLYLDNWIDAFFMHVQGAARIALRDGSRIRIGFAAKNGHPYTSIGKILIERGEIAREDMSMTAIRTWLERHPERGRELMWENRSYIFFRELPEETARLGPVGAQGVALAPGRSLAVDTSVHALGTPVWVVSATLDVHGEKGLRRLMIAQDTGSAIRGRERGDIFWGSGARAGAIAGATQHAARFYILLPNTETPRR